MNSSSPVRWSLLAIPSQPLKILIVGTGIGRLIASIALAQIGRNVVLLEQAREIAEIGAGMHVAPNALRIVDRLSVLQKVAKYCTWNTKLSIRRGQDNTKLVIVPLMPEVAESYGAPMGDIHRDDLQMVLLAKAVRCSVGVRVGHKVISIDPSFSARVQFVDGTWLGGDIVVAADGVKSGIRRQMVACHGHVDCTISTGDSAYRIMIPRERLQHDQKLLALLDEDVGIRWMRPGGHIMAYPPVRSRHAQHVSGVAEL